MNLTRADVVMALGVVLVLVAAAVFWRGDDQSVVFPAMLLLAAGFCTVALGAVLDYRRLAEAHKRYGQ